MLEIYNIDNRGKVRCSVTSRGVRATTVAVEKQKNIICFECLFVALGVQHAERMSQFIVCGLTGSTVFSILSHKRYNIRK